jgi:hypothetical protein
MDAGRGRAEPTGSARAAGRDPAGGSLESTLGAVVPRGETRGLFPSPLGVVLGRPSGHAEIAAEK